MRELVANAKGPLLCMGDYNAILQAEDRPQGSPVQDMEVKDFNEFLINSGMHELKIVGDRALVNAEWILHMPIMEVTILKPGISDHSPLRIVLDKMCQNKYKNFRFFNCIADHPRFLQLVQEAWQGGGKGGMKEIWWKLKKVIRAIKVLNNTEFRGVRDRIQNIRTQLSQIQYEMLDHNLVQAKKGQEKDLKLQLEKWSLIEDSAMRQKSRVQWLSLGDANTSYFFAHMKNRLA
ncbi:hypothetical protein R3W88_022392 [Solanum pinnatisectum]|uniref:Uncharacterized protein n=1 Tax=Solanum pinnatisectum TaxID=50273 RepID=A0AAV9LWL0_9SOLN|nr:hypothetical protein R3W88_022392 [Solanum pinnatisectum]